MKNKNIDICEVKALAFVNIKKVIETTFQHKSTMETIIEFNKQNNYEYEIISDSISEDALCSSAVINLLLNNGYVLQNEYDKKLHFKHEKLIEKEQEDKAKIKEIRGY